MPSICATRAGSVPAATCRIRPVVRSPTSADSPSGSGASPHGAARQVAMTAGSVAAHGSGGGWDSEAGGSADGDPDGLR